MAENQSTITSNAVKQAELIFSELASLMQAIDELAIDQVEDGAGGFQASKSVAIQALARQAGWLAEVGGRKLGNAGFRGGAETWLLPPGFLALQSD